jgi:hypothetical protein
VNIAIDRTPSMQPDIRRLSNASANARSCGVRIAIVFPLGAIRLQMQRYVMLISV